MARNYTEERSAIVNWLSRIENFSFDVYGFCTIASESGRTITITVAESLPSSWVSVPVALELEDDPVRATLYALSKNMYLAETHGAALALDPTNNTIFLQARFDIVFLADIDCRSFLHAFEAIADSLEVGFEKYKHEVDNSHDQPQDSSSLSIIRM